MPYRERFGYDARALRLVLVPAWLDGLRGQGSVRTGVASTSGRPAVEDAAGCPA